MPGSRQRRPVESRDLSTPLSNCLNSADRPPQQYTAGIRESAADHPSFRCQTHFYCTPIWIALLASFGRFAIPPFLFLKLHSKWLNLTSLACSEGILLCLQSPTCFVGFRCLSPRSPRNPFAYLVSFAGSPGARVTRSGLTSLIVSSETSSSLDDPEIEWI
jgi:hypothetical protein